jgi:tetratricopeptide (TPR) repeat protein
MAKRYGKTATADRAPLDKAYADAMRDLARKYPDDLDAQTLFAEAVMDTAPWNYWQTDLTPKPAAKEAIAAIESILARVKAHSGADHLYIHLVEAGPNPTKGEPSADRIGRLTPKAGHLVHMASHIYVRVGRYMDAVTVNERAVKVDEKYVGEIRPSGTYPGGYFPHNMHFLWYANDLCGRSQESIEAAKKVSQYTLDLRCGAIEGPRQRYLPLLAQTRFGHWQEILGAPAPAEEYPFDRAMWHYARGLALAATGHPEDAAREQREYEALRGSEKVKVMDNPYFPGSQILAVGGHILGGKIAGAQGRKEEAVEHFRRAVATEDTIPYMEPPYWYYSARLTLGAGLLQAGHAAEAEKEFRTDLKEFPKNGWPLFGLEQSLRAQGKDLEAREVSSARARAWKYADTELDLAWF